MEKDKYQTITDALFILNSNLKRMADGIEEVLRLVKEDQQRTKQYLEKEQS